MNILKVDPLKEIKESQPAKNPQKDLKESEVKLEEEKKFQQNAKEEKKITSKQKIEENKLKEDVFLDFPQVSNVFSGVEPIPHLGIYEKDDYKMMGKLFYNKTPGVLPSTCSFLPRNLRNALENLELKNVKFISKSTIIQYFDGSILKVNEKILKHSSYLFIC